MPQCYEHLTSWCCKSLYTLHIILRYIRLKGVYEAFSCNFNLPFTIWRCETLWISLWSTTATARWDHLFSGCKTTTVATRRHLKCGAHTAENPNACRYVCALQMMHLALPAGTVLLIIPMLVRTSSAPPSYFLTRALESTESVLDNSNLTDRGER